MVRSQSVASTAASVGDNKINFFIYYEVDGDTSKHHLSASNYGPENEWVLLSQPGSVTI